MMILETMVYIKTLQARGPMYLMGLTVDAMEELAEVLSVMHKYSEPPPNVLDAIANVQMMLNQMKLMFDDHDNEQIDEIVIKKLEQFERSLDHEKDSCPKTPTKIWWAGW